MGERIDHAKAGRIIVFVVLSALLIWFLCRIWNVITPFFLALLFAYILRPAVKGLEKLEVDSGAAILIVYAYVFIFLSAIAVLYVPILSSQSESMVAMLSQIVKRLQYGFGNAVSSIKNDQMRVIVLNIIDYAGEAVSGKVIAFFEGTAEILSVIVKTALYAILTPFIAYYFLRNNGAVAKRLSSWLPISERAEFIRLADSVDHLLRQFIIGYLLVSIAVSFLSAVFLWSIGLDYPVVLGLFMGMADIIPYFGPLIGAVPALAVALSYDLGTAIVTALGLFAIQQLESLVIAPRIMDRKVGLHPVTTIFAVLTGGWLFGVFGAVLAVPFFAAGFIILRYIWSRLVGAKIA